MRFRYGFNYKGFKFGWHEGELYRLPSIVNRKQFPFKKVPKIMIKNNEGYRVIKDRKTINQLKEITEEIDYTYSIIGSGSKDCPF